VIPVPLILNAPVELPKVRVSPEFFAAINDPSVEVVAFKVWVLVLFDVIVLQLIFAVDGKVCIVLLLSIDNILELFALGVVILFEFICILPLLLPIKIP
jgi:hypothetical protein